MRLIVYGMFLIPNLSTVVAPGVASSAALVAVPVGVLLAAPVTIAEAKPDIELMLQSEPVGATATAQGRTYGTTPVMIRVDTNRNQKCIALAAITFTWASGASVSSDEGLVICESAGKRQTLSFARPTGVPGAEFDYQYALELQQLELMRQQIAASTYAAEQQRRLAAYQIRQQRMRAELEAMKLRPLLRPGLGVNCISNRIGNTVYTNCR